MKERRRYYLIRSLRVNGKTLNEVMIDPRVDKHRDHISDELIVYLVRLLDNSYYGPADENEDYAYFVSLIHDKGKNYRLVWLLERGKSYIGILTAFREKGVKNGIS